MKVAWQRHTGAKVVERRSRRWSQRGDTLVEVTIAFAVLGLVLGATSSIINRSLLNIMNATERTTARGEINSQAELLRYVIEHSDDNRKAYDDITAMVNNGGGDDLSSNKGYGCTATGNAFYLTYDSSDTSSEAIKVNKVSNTSGEHDMKDVAQFAPHAEGGQGIWIDGAKHSVGVANSPDYVDFYVRACWTPYAAEEVGQGRLESIVRIALPRS